MSKLIKHFLTLRALFALLGLATVWVLLGAFAEPELDPKLLEEYRNDGFWARPEFGENVLNQECEQSNKAFNPGERIVYKMYYNLNFVWIPAGEVVFQVEDKGAQFRLTAIGSTYSSYEWFFKVRDRYESYIDKATLLPVLSIREVNEGNYQLYERVEYDQRGRKVRSWRGRSKDEAMKKAQSVTAQTCLHDVLSSIYFIRNYGFENVKPQSRIPVSVIMDRTVYPLNVRYVGKHTEKRIKGLGKFSVHELAPEVVAGDVFDEGTEMRVWASTGRNQVPLLIESPLSVGSVKAVLKSHHNLRYPLGGQPE